MKFQRLRQLLDLRDVVFFSGLAVASVGGFMISVPWTLIAVGATLTAVAKFGGR